MVERVERLLVVVALEEREPAVIISLGGLRQECSYLVEGLDCLVDAFEVDEGPAEVEERRCIGRADGECMVIAVNRFIVPVEVCLGYPLVEPGFRKVAFLGKGPVECIDCFGIHGNPAEGPALRVKRRCTFRALDQCGIEVLDRFLVPAQRIKGSAVFVIGIGIFLVESDGFREAGDCVLVPVEGCKGHAFPGPEVGKVRPDL